MVMKDLTITLPISQDRILEECNWLMDEKTACKKQIERLDSLIMLVQRECEHVWDNLQCKKCKMWAD